MTALLDNRTKTAAAGSIAGAAAPLALLIMLGLVRRRYRCCDEVVEDLLPHTPFIAVIPDAAESNLLAVAAARAIHNLRVRLQPAVGDGPQTFLVTSVSAGEGKTSVALSLGLSFAAAGFRTLLIDADLTSRRLTSGFEAAALPGALEIIAGSDPQIRSTRPGLSILTAGSGPAHDSLRLKHTAVTQLLSAIADRFDVILIDSDVALDGITASMIAPQVNGVILALARGQEASLACSALRHIELIGARIAGIVYNRADAADLRNASHDAFKPSAAAKRPFANRLNRFGPLVAGVLASLSFHREDDLDLLPAGPAAPRVEPAALAA